MRKLTEIWQAKIIVISGTTVSVSQVIILILVLLLVISLSRFSKFVIFKSKFFKQLGEKFKQIVARALSYLIWLSGFILILKLEKVDTKGFFEKEIFKISDVSITVQKVVALIVVIFIVRLIVLIIDYAMNRRIERDNLDLGKGKSILQITKYFIWITGILIGIGAMGLKLTFIIASVSALLVGVGFGLQNIFNDFFSGIIILFDGSIKVQDVVQVGDIVGRVTEIGIRTTKVLNRDNIILIIPNSKFTTDNVINWSHIDQKSRFSVAVGVAYGSDVKLVEKLLLSCAHECDEVVSEPKPFVRFEDFGESSLNFKLYFWTNNSFYVENTKSVLRFAIDQKFRENHIVIPFPQRDVHLKN